MPKNRLKGLYRAGIALLGHYPLHGHEFGEVFWIDRGRCIHTVNGKRQILNAGDFVLIRPTDRHSLDNPRKQLCQLNNVAFRWDVYEYIRKRYMRNDGSIYGEDLELPKTVSLTDRQLGLLRNFFPSLFKGEQSRLQVERFLLNVFAEIFPGLEELPNGSSSKQLLPLWLENARVAIRDPERLQLGVEEFYRLCYRSPAHVARECRRFLNETPGSFLRRLRMEHAGLQLSGTTRDIIDISLDCGFESLSHFYSCFRKAHGISPRQYRLQRQAMMVDDSD